MAERAQRADELPLVVASSVEALLARIEQRDPMVKAWCVALRSSAVMKQQRARWRSVEEREEGDDDRVG